MPPTPLPPALPLLTRRSLLRKSAALGTAAASSALLHSQDASTPAAKSEHAATPDFCLFTKHLLGMEPDALAEHVATLGFKGIEAPIRPGGHVEPSRVTGDLPEFVESLAKANLKLSILTSGINEISEAQHTLPVLRTAAALGIKYFRMNWYQYDLTKPLRPQLETILAKARDLIAFCRETGIRPLYQNHNGSRYVGAAIWDIEPLMREFAPEDWGFAYDVMHASVVGGTSWESAWHLARPLMGAVCFKDFTWQKRLQPATCPLGEGTAAGPEIARLLRSSHFTGPVSLHIEYLKAQRITQPAEAQLAHDAAARDLATLRNWWRN